MKERYSCQFLIPKEDNYSISFWRKDLQNQTNLTYLSEDSQDCEEVKIVEEQKTVSEKAVYRKAEKQDPPGQVHFKLLKFSDYSPQISQNN